MAVGYRRSWIECRELRHDCRVCARRPEAKLSWGCEVEAEEPQLSIPCEACLGLRVDTSDCPDCHGTGEIEIYRCPLAILWPESAELFELHRHWPGTLPLPGGIYDQPALYVDAMRMLDGAVAVFEQRLREVEEAKHKPSQRTR